MKGKWWNKSVAHIHFAGSLWNNTSNGAVSTERTSPAITHQPWTEPLKNYPTSLLFPDTFYNRGSWWKLTEDLLQCCLLSWVKRGCRRIKWEISLLGIYIQIDCSEFSCSLLDDLGDIGLLQYSSQYSEPVYKGKCDENEILFHTLVNFRWSPNHRTQCAKMMS